MEPLLYKKTGTVRPLPAFEAVLILRLHAKFHNPEIAYVLLYY